MKRSSTLMGAMVLLLFTANAQSDTMYVHHNGEVVFSRATNLIDSVTFFAHPFTVFVCGNTFTDSRDGNEYQTVQVGNQCWFSKNLAYLPSVYVSMATSQTEPRYYVYGYNGDWVPAAKATVNYNAYGVLYNWPAAMAGSASSTANPSGVQGICPNGWHVPSSPEFTQLINYMETQGFPNQGDSLNGAGNALKSCRQVNSPLGGDCHTTEHPRWYTSSNHHGFDTFGFKGLPGGYLSSDGTFINLDLQGHWWSATEGDSDIAWSWFLYYGNSYVYEFQYHKMFGFPVRCVRD